MSSNSDLATQRTVVSQLWANNIRKPAEIMRITGFPKSTIHDLVKKLKERGSLTPLPRSGRPRILTTEKRRYLGLLIKNNNTITATEIATKLNEKYPNLNVSERTVQRTLTDDLQYVVVTHCEFFFFNPFILTNVLNGPKIMHRTLSLPQFFRTRQHFKCFVTLSWFGITVGTHGRAKAW